MKHAKKLIILILVISIIINLELRFVTDNNYVLLNLKVDNEDLHHFSLILHPMVRTGMHKGLE